ncbi:immunoglobulin domain-containing protein [Cytophagales bacterium LB-30]|uniref:Immunoglobulin domain-containing protein n=1 Tax=Shiella aurantiaca TaxID=3058365 RepID=A0ABT8F5A1_9BACT|nr:immunoglobulin domain-containing protein [Shiella aurantiaca]MDN4165643.1 immunoglobulin domain-containing protein [Shiella aurantiaca]
MRKLFLFFMALICFSSVFGQAGQLDPSFNPIPGGTPFIPTETTGTITKYIKQPDGKIIAIGTFSGAIKRYNTNGTVDATFLGPGITGGFIKDLVLLNDGKMIMVGNTVTSANGTIYMGKLNANGTVDTSFPRYIPSGNFNLITTDQFTSTVMISGTFTDLQIGNGPLVARPRYALISTADGTLFSTNGGFDGTVNAIYKDAQGRVLCVGAFTSFQGNNAPGIVRLNANFQLDATFNASGTGLSGDAFCITEQPDGKYIIGGNLTAYDGNAVNRLARINTNGSFDNTFAPSAFDNSILSLAVAGDKIVAGGSFTTYGGASAIRLVSLNSDGSLNTSFSIGSGFNNNVQALLSLGEGKVLVGGDFTTVKGGNRRNPVPLNAYGNLTLNNGAGVVGGNITRMAEQADGKVIIVGSFTEVRGITRNGVARLNVDGSLDESFSSGTGFTGVPYAIAIQSDGKILIGGDFSQFNGQAQSRLVRLNSDGSKDNTFTPLSLNNSVNDLVVADNGSIFVAGGFGLTGGNGFTKLTSAGLQDGTFSTSGGANGAVSRIHLYPDGKIFLVGAFSSFNGNTSVAKAVRLNADGTVDTNFTTSSGGVGFDTYQVNTVAVQSDGKLLLGGNFPYYQRGGVTTNSRGLIRLNTDGSFDGTFQYNNGFNINAAIYDIILHPSGQIAVAGSIAAYSGTTVNGLAYFNDNGSFIPEAISGSNFNGVVNDLMLREEGKVVVAGTFTNYNGANYNGLVQLGNPCEHTVQTSLSICQDDTYTFGTQTLSAAGIYTETFTNQQACDSTVTLTLSVIQTNYTASIQRCKYETVSYGGQNFTSYGDFVVTIPRTGTCDSIVSLSVVPSPVQESIINASICEGETYEYTTMAWNDNDEYVAFSESLTSAGTYQYTQFLGTDGCETNVTVNLSVIAPQTVEIDDFLCTESYTFGSQTLTETGTFTELFTSSAGCDSTVVLTLSRRTEEISYNPDSKYITASSSYNSYKLYKDNTLIETNTNSGSINYLVSECGEYKAEFGGSACQLGISATKAGSGCGATLTITVENAVLPLTSNISFPGNTAGNTAVRNTNSFTYTGVCPSTYTVRVTDANGCEISISVDFNTADTFWNIPVPEACTAYSQVLSIDPGNTYAESRTICEGDSYTFGADILSVAGEYQNTFTSSTGCDSIVVLTLQVNPNPITQLVYNEETMRITGSNPNHSSYQLFKDDVVVAQSLSSSTIDYLAEECGDYRAEFGTLGCNISFTGNTTGFNNCAFSVNLATSNAALPLSYSLKSYRYSAFNNQTRIIQDLSGTSNSSDFIISDVCFNTYSYLIIEDANGCLQEIYLDNNNSSNFSQGGNGFTPPTCTPSSNVLSISRPQSVEQSLDLCQGESLQFGNQLITGAGVFTELFTTGTGCDSTVVLSVNQLTPAAIVTQPASATLCESSSLQLNVEATGSGITYQWYKGADPIEGATAATLIFEALAFEDAGDYSVEVTGTCGEAVSSAIATVVVNSPPTINQQPVSLTVCDGESATFYVEVAGQSASNFQWKKDGLAIEGENATSLTIAAATLADQGRYTVEFTEECGVASSSIATLVVNEYTSISQEPVSIIGCEGNTANLSVTALGGNLSYQWYKDGSAITGASSATLNFNDLALENSGDYSVEITGACGNTVVSTTATVEVQASVRIEESPIAQAVCAGSNAQFNVAATGSGTLTYQWKKDGQLLDGAINPSLEITGTDESKVGLYSVVITGKCNEVESEPVSLSIATPVSILSQPTPSSICEGNSATLSVLAEGSELVYEWRKNGEILIGATQNVLTIENASTAQAGDYSVTITGACGQVVSELAALVVNPATSITTVSPDQTLCEGEALLLEVSASGSGAISYQWMKDGLAIQGANNSSYSLASSTLTDAAEYTVEVTSTCGSLSSSPIQVSVTTTTQITLQPQNTSVCEGQNTSLEVQAMGQNLVYEWRKGGEIVGTTAALQFTNVSADLAGLYVVEVSGDCGSILSNEVLLTVFTAEPIEMNESACGSFDFNGETYTESGQYPISLTNENGCPYVLTLNLTITQIDNSVSQNGSVLTSQQEGASYQWINCSTQTPIDGATSISFTPEEAGSYAVQITLNGCETVSTCMDITILGIKGLLSHKLNYYPNPVENRLTLQFEEAQAKGQLQIIALNGDIVSSQEFEGKELVYDTDYLKSGIYYLKIQNNKGTSVIKLLKK